MHVCKGKPVTIFMIWAWDRNVEALNFTVQGLLFKTVAELDVIAPICRSACLPRRLPKQELSSFSAAKVQIFIPNSPIFSFLFAPASKTFTIFVPEKARKRALWPPKTSAEGAGSDLIESKSKEALCSSCQTETWEISTTKWECIMTSMRRRGMYRCTFSLGFLRTAVWRCGYSSTLLT